MNESQAPIASNVAPGRSGRWTGGLLRSDTLIIRDNSNTIRQKGMPKGKSGANDFVFA
jgi:hypothetical protein